MSRIKPGNEARLLSELDQLPEEEVTSLLVSLLAEQKGSKAPSADDSGAGAASAAGAEDASQLLSNLDRLTDEEVNSLLGKMLAEGSFSAAPAAEPPGAAAGVGRQDAGVKASGRDDRAGEGSMRLEHVSVEELSDEEVTSLLGELLSQKGLSNE